ncbi:MAG: galactose oxidase [Prochlorococcus sp.]
MSSSSPAKRFCEQEGWQYMPESALSRSRSSSVCMTCQHFDYACDRYCHTLLTCGLHRQLIPHGEHLTKRCRHWLRRRELEIGWCPEVA